MTPADWARELAPTVPTRQAQAFIAKIARAHLQANVLLDRYVSTYDLVEALFPATLAAKSAEGEAVRKRMFKALTDRALGRYELADCMSYGPRQRRQDGSTYQPCQWHAPRRIEKCRECGRPL